MTSQLTQIAAQQHTANLLRAADRDRVARRATRRGVARRPRIWLGGARARPDLRPT